MWQWFTVALSCWSSSRHFLIFCVYFKNNNFIFHIEIEREGIGLGWVVDWWLGLWNCQSRGQPVMVDHTLTVTAQLLYAPSSPDQANHIKKKLLPVLNKYIYIRAKLGLYQVFIFFDLSKNIALQTRNVIINYVSWPVPNHFKKMLFCLGKIMYLTGCLESLQQRHLKQKLFLFHKYWVRLILQIPEHL